MVQDADAGVYKSSQILKGIFRYINREENYFRKVFIVFSKPIIRIHEKSFKDIKIKTMSLASFVLNPTQQYII